MNIINNIIRLCTLLMMTCCIVGFCVVAKETKTKIKAPKIILMILGMVSCAYACLVISMHYSVDSFNLIYDTGAYWHMQLGRYLNCGEILWEELLGLNPVTDQRFFAILWIVSLSISIYVVNDAMNTVFNGDSDKWKQLAVLAAVSLSFINIFMMEFVLFPEMMAFNIYGVIALSLAIWFALRNKGFLKRWLLAFLFLMIALGNYQSYIGVFEAFVLVGFFFSWRGKQKEKYKNLSMSLIVGGLASAINVILVKVLVAYNILSDSGRGAGLELKTIIHNVNVLWHYQKVLWLNADGLMPRYIMPLLAVSLLVILVYTIKGLVKAEKIEFIIIVFVSYFLGFAPHIIENNIWLTPRSNLAIWSVIASLLIAGTNVQWKTKIGIKTVVSVCTCILFVNIFVMQDMAANNQAVNAADFVEADQICNKIKEYEAETGNVIQRVAIGYDKEPTIYQRFSRYKKAEFGARILVTSYSGYRLISYQLGRSLQKIDMPELIYNEYYKNKNWDCLDVNEQLMFENDTAYLMIY